jgi:hypothetical protein
MAIEVFDYPGIETLLVVLVYEGRVLPVAFSCFMKWSIQKSQNILEHRLVLAVMSCFSIERQALLILDRGYARVNLFIYFRNEWIPFLCRAKRSVMVYLQSSPTSFQNDPTSIARQERHPMVSLASQTPTFLRSVLVNPRHLIGHDPNSLGPSSTKRSPLVPRIHSNRLSLLSPSFVRAIFLRPYSSTKPPFSIRQNLASSPISPTSSRPSTKPYQK